MTRLSHPVASLVIVAVLATLLVTIFTGMEEDYDIQRNFTVNNQTIMEEIKNVNILESMNDTLTSVYKLANPNENFFFDIVGGLAGTAVGVIKVIGTLITLPFELIMISYKYYHLETVIAIGLSVLIVIYVGFKILTAYLRSGEL